jgi:CubicO group peptidase (beta-lactamase class C family)
MIINVFKVLPIVLLVIISSCVRDGPLSIDKPIEYLSKELDEYIPPLMDKYHVAGLSVLVIKNNKVALSKSFGYANLESGKRIDKNTVYRAASLGKPVFAYIVTYLAQQGKIDLDKSISSYMNDEIVENDPRSKLITARMVLSHTTGLPNLGEQAELKFDFEPGHGFKYSGHGYLFLQRAIERITGKPLNELANEILFKPLSMTASSYIWRKDYEGIISSSYHGADKVKYVEKQETLVGYSAWSLYTTLDDYSKFISHIMRSSKVDGSIASQLLVPTVDVARGVKWGLGWGIQDTNPNQSFWHWGSMAGFRHYVVGYPEEQVAVIVMSNSKKSFKMIDDVMVKSIGGSYPSYDWF